MPKAYGPELAWRVVWRATRALDCYTSCFCWYTENDEEWYDDDDPEEELPEFLPWWLVKEISDPRHGLAVSVHYVNDVWMRFYWTGEVETHQGFREAPPALQKLTLEEDMSIILSITEHPRWQLKEHCAAVNSKTGQQIAYSTFCTAVWRLGYTRQKIRSVCYKADTDRADAWLMEVLSFYALWQLFCIDETSKDMSVLKGSFGYAARGHHCICHDLPALSHGSRTSAVVVFTPYEGFLDWAFTRGTFNTTRFVEVTTENFVDWTGALRGPILLDHIDQNSLVFLDGAAIHPTARSKDKRFEERVNAKGAQIKIIPPYCWFLSPLDNGAFGRLVQFLQANSGHVATNGIEHACEAGFGSCLSEADSLRCWYKCGYVRTT